MTCRKRKSRLFLWGSLLFLWTVCCGLFGKDPRAVAYPFPGEYDAVWKATMETLTAENIPLQEFDPAKGYIQTKTFPLYKEEYSAWAEKPLFAAPGFCLLEIGVKSEQPGMTLVGIKAYFKRKNGLYLGGYRKRDASREVFEKLLLGKINDRLLKTLFPRLKDTVVGCAFRYEDSKKHYVIRDADAGGLAYEQGLRDGDVLLKIDGEEIHPGNLFKYLLTVERESVRSFTVKRKGAEMTVSVSIFYFNPEAPRLGMSVMRDRANDKFQVLALAPNSAAELAGFRTGDVLLRENEITLDSWKNYYRAMLAEEPGKEQVFQVLRNGTPLALKITPASKRQG